MSSKVLLLKYLPQFSENDKSAQNITASEKTAIVLEKTRGNYISIQGYTPVSCREKLKCWTLFQQAVKNLLAIPETTSVCIHFEDSPRTSISNLTTLFEQPNYMLDLIVTPLPTTLQDTTSQVGSSSFALKDQVDTSSDNRGTYCKFRDMYRCSHRNGTVVKGRSNGCVREKVDFAEMNRLISQLADVSLSLQRTRDECERIAEKCGTSTSPIGTQGSDCLNGVDGDHVDGSHVTPSLQTAEDEAIKTADKKVEQLLQIAESILKQQQSVLVSQSHAPSTSSDNVTPTSSSTHPLPDCPSEVCVRPSFTPGGVYIMWNPVSLDALDQNNGHKVLGYLIYIGGVLARQVEGALTSQVELTPMEHGMEYHVQVCTHTEHCDSKRSQPLIYKHSESNKKQPNKANHLTTTKLGDKDSKTARVESWLKHGQISLSQHANIETSSPNYDDHTQIESHDQLTMVDGPCDDDTKSISSSHTSGIVTDYPVSPKLHSSNAVRHCSKLGPYSSCDHHESTAMVTVCHHHGNGLSMPSSHIRHHQLKDNTPTSSSVSMTGSTLCPSPIPSTNFTLDHTYTVDTIIDEPLGFDNLSEVDLAPSSCGTTRHHEESGRKRNGYLCSIVNHKTPAPPQDVLVVGGKTSGTIIVSWTPVRRDVNGCSNGCYVLGYRIYVNGSFHQSVDGAITSKATVTTPTYSFHQLSIYVTSRSLTGESVPSTTVTHNSLLQGKRGNSPLRSNKLDSVISSTVDSSSICTKPDSLLSHPHSTSTHSTATPSHQAAHRRSHLETYV